MTDLKKLPEFNVYDFPRMHPVIFAKYCHADPPQRETLLRESKFVPKIHFPRATLARDAINSFFMSPAKDVESLNLELKRIERNCDEMVVANDESYAAKIKDCCASIAALQSFIQFHNQLGFLGKELRPCGEDFKHLVLEGLTIPLPLSAVILSTSRLGVRRLGGLYLNTQKGDAIKGTPITVQKRNNAGEQVAILVMRYLQDFCGDLGTPAPSDVLHLHVRQKRLWSCPDSYKKKMKNMEASSREVCQLWSTITPPKSYRSERATIISKS